LLINSNFEINTQYSKCYKKYSFNISNILFIITVSNDNYKITEVYKKNGKIEKKFCTEKLISNELINIKNYLENKKKT